MRRAVRRIGAWVGGLVAVVALLALAPAWAVGDLVPSSESVGVGGLAVLGTSIGLAFKLTGLVQTLITDRLSQRGGGAPPTETVRDGLGSLAATLVSDREHVLAAVKKVDDIHGVIAARDSSDQALSRLRHEEHVRESLAALAGSVRAMTAAVDRLIVRIDRQLGSDSQGQHPGDGVSRER